jgi:hypothetical protein
MVYARGYFFELRANEARGFNILHLKGPCFLFTTLILTLLETRPHSYNGNFITSVRKIGPTVLYITFYVVQHRRGFRPFQYNRLETADSVGVGHFATLW